jgi:hypothetical protein
MKLILNCCLGLFASLALMLFVSNGVRAQDTSTDTNNNPTTAESTEATAQSPTTTAQAQTPSTTAQQSPEVKAQKMAECESMGMGAGMHAMHRQWMEGREGGMMGMPMMGMPMMGDHMAMMRMISHNPKMAGRMLEMRADMMRAVADVMARYGKQMESGEWQSFQTSSAAGQTGSNEQSGPTGENSSTGEY